MAKAKQRFSWTYNHETGEATAKDIILDKSVTWALHTLSEEIQNQVSIYGLGKVLQDRCSQVSADDKLTAMTATFESLLTGKWKSDRVAGSRFVSPIGQVIQDFKKCSVAAAQAAYTALSDEAKIALKEGQKDAIEAVIEARAKQDEVSLDDMISG